MAHSLSAEKRHRQSLKRRARNRPVRTAARSYVTKAIGLIKAGTLPEAEVAVREALSVLDQAQKKGVIHANSAARRKSRLMARYNAAVEAAAVAEAEPAAPTEEPVKAPKRRPGRKAAEKAPARSAKAPAAAKGRAAKTTAAKAPAAAKGRARATKAPAKKKKTGKK